MTSLVCPNCMDPTSQTTTVSMVACSPVAPYAMRRASYVIMPIESLFATGTITRLWLLDMMKSQGTTINTKALFADWESTIDNLSSRISSAVLARSLVCVVVHHDVDVAKRVVAPLVRLPLLKDCHLGLSNPPTAELRILAQDASLKSCGVPYPQGPEPSFCSPATSSPPF